MAAYIITVANHDDAHTTALYLISGAVSSDEISRLTTQLLCDPVIQTAAWYDLHAPTIDPIAQEGYEVAFRQVSPTTKPKVSPLGHSVWVSPASPKSAPCTAPSVLHPPTMT
jgi:hypothetical protein